MNDLEYNLYIKNYLENDKTKSAIMLIAPWGMGKSYYIQNSLIPYLKENGNKKCVVVSLYGLTDIKEISKAIYLEIRAKAISEKSEKIAAGKIVGKTVLKGALSIVGIDLSVDESDLEKLYSSIDLSDKLLIFEDLERSDISIKQVLGYVNNLVEQDGVKVLLIANENEIKEYKKIESKDKDGNTVPKWIYTDETNEYLKIKEKTVSDTVLYLCDYDAAIQNILKIFENIHINRCLESTDKNGKSTIISEISSVMADVKIYNLRSLIFACQKTVDIFSRYEETLDIDFFKHVFLGNIAFALRLKNNDDLKWTEQSNPNALGTSKYPLHKFCYDYIKYQELDVSEIKSLQEMFLEKQDYEKKQREANTALSILYDFTTQKENILSCAVESIRDELKDSSTIPLIQYGKLANYLIAVKCAVNNPSVIDECKSIMLENMQNSTQKDEKILDRLKIHDSFAFWDDTQTNEYNEFIIELSTVFQINAYSHIDSENPINYVENIAALMYDDNGFIRQRKSFMEKLNVDKIIIGLENSSAKQVSEFRKGILNVYGIANINDFLPNDGDSLTKLKSGVQTLLVNENCTDKLIRLQYSWLIDNIASALENYSRSQSY